MTAAGTRAFLAVGLTDETRDLLAAHLGAHGFADFPGRPVAPGNWHITLRFLGWSTAEQQDRILHGISTAELPERFRIRFGGLGAFPKPRRATVIWLGLVSGGEELTRLAEISEFAATAAGFKSEDRPYHPHLTLSRVRPPVDVTTQIGSAPPFDVTMPVDRVVLYESILGPGGATYVPLDHIAL